MRRRVWTVGAVPLLIAAVAAVAACGSDSGSSGDTGGGGDAATLTIYNAQHEELVSEMVSAFTAETGIDVEMRNGSDLEMANQIVQEGDRSPADVFLTENSPGMTLVDSHNGFSPVQAATLKQVPKRYRPADGQWTGFAARSTVLVYDEDQVPPADLPKSLMDLADPEWKGKVGYSPTGADFQAIVSAVLALEGEAATERWLDGLAENALAYQGNIRTMAAVNQGEVPVGVIYHYYWYRDQAESGENSGNTALHYFGNEDPGAFVSVSGAGILQSTDQPAAAQRLLEFLTGPTGQKVLADSYALEYPVGSGVPANPALKPLTELDAPVVDPDELNSEQVVTMMQDAGIL
jgi:iron(III) transport system substrate-binding protein